jgi:hypothetical protein
LDAHLERQKSVFLQASDLGGREIVGDELLEYTTGPRRKSLAENQ